MKEPSSEDVLVPRRPARLATGRSEEFDAVVSNGDIVLVAESKSTLKSEYVRRPPAWHRPDGTHVVLVPTCCRAG